MRTDIFNNVQPIKTRDLTEFHVAVDVRLAIDNILDAMVKGGVLHNSEEADALRKVLYTPGDYNIPMVVIMHLENVPRRNDIHMIRLFFWTENKPVTDREFYEFWNSLSISDRLFMLLVPLG